MPSGHKLRPLRTGGGELVLLKDITSGALNYFEQNILEVLGEMMGVGEHLSSDHF